MHLTAQATRLKLSLKASVCDNVLEFPGGACPLSEADVERINLYDSYNLGGALAALRALTSKFEDDGVHPASAMYPMWQARSEMMQLLNQSPVPLGVSKASAEALLRELVGIFRDHFPEGTWPDQSSPLIPSWKLSMLKSGIEKFETVFGEEMAGLATYCVPRRGIFDTPALVDTADDCFPKDLLPHVPQKARIEWRAAGRCMAFNLLSASGFHVARAVEGTMEAYFHFFVQQPAKALNSYSWGDYLSELEQVQKAAQPPIPEEKTLSEFRQMKDDYRNPIMHPRVILTDGDAKMLFNNGESLIIAMAQEIAKIQAANQPSLALVPPPSLLSSAIGTT
jgi:hypothetical protein